MINLSIMVRPVNLNLQSCRVSGARWLTIVGRNVTASRSKGWSSSTGRVVRPLCCVCRGDRDACSSTRSISMVRSSPYLIRCRQLVGWRNKILLIYGKPDNRARALIRPTGGTSTNGSTTRFRTEGNSTDTRHCGISSHGTVADKQTRQFYSSNYLRSTQHSESLKVVCRAPHT